MRRGRLPGKLAETLRNWRKQDQINRHARDDGLTGSGREESAALRRKNTRLMRKAGVSGPQRVKRGRTTIRVSGVRVADDLVERRLRVVRGASRRMAPLEGLRCGLHNEWRDPDSNRGHHDFQAAERRENRRGKSLQIGMFLGHGSTGIPGGSVRLSVGLGREWAREVLNPGFVVAGGAAGG